MSAFQMRHSFLKFNIKYFPHQLQTKLTMAISFVPCKEIRIPKSGKYLLLESGIRENFATGIRNTAKDCNPESKFH